MKSNESDDDLGDEDPSPTTEEDSDGSRAVLAWAEVNCCQLGISCDSPLESSVSTD